MTEMLKSIIFDFDGTIADSFTIVEHFGLQLAEKYGLRIDSAEARRIGLRKTLEKASFPAWKVPRVLLELKKAIAKGIRDEVELFSGMKQVLERLQTKYHLGIVSSNSRENIEAFLDKNQIRHLFTFIHSDSSLFGKHVVLKRLCKKREISLAEMMYVGDEDRDIQAARRLKIPVIAVSWGYNVRELLENESPDYLVDTPDQILGELFG